MDPKNEESKEQTTKTSKQLPGFIQQLLAEGEKHSIFSALLMGTLAGALGLTMWLFLADGLNAQEDWLVGSEWPSILVAPLVGYAVRLVSKGKWIYGAISGMIVLLTCLAANIIIYIIQQQQFLSSSVYDDQILFH
jgi:hypothetical protein